MIVEFLIASVAAVTIVGTVAGLRFAERALTPEERRAKAQQEAERKRAAALKLVHDAIAQKTGVSRADVLALLATEPELLPDDVRVRAVQWSRGETITVPNKMERRS